MCLISIQKKPFIAKEDIVCYKYLFEDNGNLITPYANEKVCKSQNIIGNKQKPSLLDRFFPQKEKMQAYDGQEHISITQGYIHTYYSINRLLMSAPRYAKIFSCIIPKGTKYWVGEAGDYASTKIIYKEQIDYFDLSEKISKPNYSYFQQETPLGTLYVSHNQ